MLLLTKTRGHQMGGKSQTAGTKEEVKIWKAFQPWNSMQFWRYRYKHDRLLQSWEKPKVKTKFKIGQNILRYRIKFGKENFRR